MIDQSTIKAIFDQYAPQVGALGGDLFDVYRPNYSVVDNTPVLVASQLRFRCDPIQYSFAEPRYQGVQFYDIFGPRDILQSGDILIKSEPDGGMTPPITIATFFEQKALTGFRTARLARITNASNDPQSIYTNVYFEFISITYPGTPTNKKIEESLRIPSTRVVIFKRSGVNRLRMHFIEIDGSFERKWSITQYEHSGPIMILTLDNN